MPAKPPKSPAVAAVSSKMTADEVSRTPDQQRAFAEAATAILERKGRALKSYWEVGGVVLDLVADADRIASQELTVETSKYGANAVKAAAALVGMSQTELYKAQAVARAYTEAQIDQLATVPGLTYSHIAEATRIANDARRMAMLEQLPSKPPEQRTVEALSTEIAVVNATPEAREEADAVAEANREAGIKGGGSRSGTGRGSSPVTPVKNLGASLEKAADLFGAVAISMGSIDDCTAKQQTALLDAINFALGNLAEVYRTGIGFLRKAEELISMRATSKAMTDAQAARRDTYAATATGLKRAGVALEDVNTLSPEEKELRFDAIDDTPKSRPKEPAPAVPPANPVVAAATNPSVAAMREKARALRARSG